MDLNYLINDVWEEHGAQLTKGMLTSPFHHVVPVVGIYLTFVCYIGPRFMQDRKPYHLNRLIKWYNYVNIACNGIMCILGVYYTRGMYECWFCQESSAPKSLVVLGRVCYGCSLSLLGI